MIHWETPVRLAVSHFKVKVCSDPMGNIFTDISQIITADLPPDSFLHHSNLLSLSGWRSWWIYFIPLETVGKKIAIATVKPRVFPC